MNSLGRINILIATGCGEALVFLHRHRALILVALLGVAGALSLSGLAAVRRLALS